MWLATTPTTAYPALTGEIEADIAVVGAGIAGVTTALLLQESGLQVALVEARRLLEGVTGNTTAKLTSQHGLAYSHIRKSFGAEAARAYGEANQAALEWVVSRVQRDAIDCDLVRTFACVVAQQEDEVEKLQEEVEAAREAGLPASFIRQSELPLPISGGVRFENQARFHPRRYLLALVEQFIRAGGRIFEDSRVLKVEEGEPCRLQTAAGEVRARQVVLATHYPTVDHALYIARLAQHRSQVLAVEIDGPLPQGMYLCDEPFFSLRRQPGPRGDLLFVGGQKYKAGQGGDTVARYLELEEWARRHFPVRDVAFRWSTQDVWTADGVPYIGLASPASRHLYVATGFGGWGMTGATNAALLLRDLITGAENPWAEVFDPQRVNLASVPSLIGENINAVSHLVGDHLAKASRGEPGAGEGMVVESGEGKVALYRDESNRLHRLSPKCTHIGCILGWNPAERTWDCPCHGSRFTAEGCALQAPAVEDLEILAAEA